MVTTTAARPRPTATAGWKTARRTRTTPASTRTSGQRSRARTRRSAGTHPKLTRKAISEGGQPVVVMRDGIPLAVVAEPFAIGGGQLGGLPRWEEWLHEMRQSFSNGGQSGPLRPALPEPPALDKALLGFDPRAGSVGSEAGREYLAGELARLGVPVRDENLLAVVYSALLAVCEDKERLYEEDVRVLAQQLIAQAPQRLRLLAVTITSSTGLPATAEVIMELGTGPAMCREHGDGPL